MSEKGKDLIYALAWWIYNRLKGFLGVSEPVIYKDCPETQETIARLTAENDELKKELRYEKFCREAEKHREAASAKGPNRPNAKKLTDREVSEIRDMKRRGWTNVEIATTFDVNRATISRIVRGQYHKKAGTA